MSMTTTVSSYVGIDIFKNRLDVHVRPAGTAFSVPRDPDGLVDLVRRLRSLMPTLIVLEATGGFEVTVAAAIAGTSLPLAVINPRQVRDFTGSGGLDARAAGRSRSARGKTRTA